MASINRPNWDHKLEMLFLQHYHAENILWNTKHTYYRDKNQKYAAWNRISNAMHIEIDELKRKKDSLLSSYRLYRNKVKRSLANGSEEVFKPIWFAYAFMDSFLSNGSIEIKHHDSEGENSDDPLSHEQELEEDDKRNVYLLHVSDDGNDQHITPSTPPKRRRGSRVQAHEEIYEDNFSFGGQMSQSYRINNPQEEDDCDRYSKILANKLRKLPEDERLIFMHKIDGMFVKRIQDKLNSSNA